MTKPNQPSSGASGGSYTVPFAAGERQGTCCSVVRDFIVFGGVGAYGGAATTDGYYIRWCAIGDPTDWPQPATDDARSKQAGEQSFPTEYGWITAMAGNDFYGYVFQEKAITKMTYVGGDVVFAFDTFEENRGCIAQGRIAQIDDKVFFQSDRGYHVLENDQIADIGHGLVDGTYF